MMPCGNHPCTLHPFISWTISSYHPSYKISIPFLRGTCYLIRWFKLYLRDSVTRFFTSGFFFKQLLLAPVDKPSNDFNFFRIFAEIFDFYGASPAAPVNNSSPVSTTPVSDTFTVLKSFTGVNDTGKKFLTGIIDTSEACIRQCQWHWQSMYLPVPLTPACMSPVSLTPVTSFITGVIDTRQ